jgi:hypothetical protein
LNDATTTFHDEESGQGFKAKTRIYLGFLNYPQRLWITLWKTSSGEPQVPVPHGFPYFAFIRGIEKRLIKSKACASLPKLGFDLILGKQRTPQCA